MLPDFKAQLGNLIAAKVPPPVTQEVTVFNLFGGGEVDEYAFDSYERRKLRTKLTAIIPLEDGATASVTIFASSYPDANDPNSAKKIDYRVDVEELDEVLVIKGSEAVLQSKRWEHEPFTEDTPIGVTLPSWPAWEHPARAEDIQRYQELLDALNQPGITFEGSTPPIPDYSKI
jgi:hypothetical protein